MQITHRARWEHATRATKGLAGWKLRAFESVVVAGGTYYGLRHVYSQGEAMPHMLALAIATVAGLVVFPVFEFASHYLDAPRAIELASLREENARLKGQVPISASPISADPVPAPTVAHEGPPKVYVKEQNPEAVFARLKTLKWNELDPVVRASYLGFWVRWKGEIATVQAFGEGGERATYVVNIWGDGPLGPRSGPFITLNFTAQERHKVLPLEKGQTIEYEGKLVKVATFEIALDNVTIGTIT
jgi:hypothetical protein